MAGAGIRWVWTPIIAQSWVLRLAVIRTARCSDCIACCSRQRPAGRRGQRHQFPRHRTLRRNRRTGRRAGRVTGAPAATAQGSRSEADVDASHLDVRRARPALACGDRRAHRGYRARRRIQSLSTRSPRGAMPGGAGCMDALPLAVVRSAWPDALNLPSLSKRFRAGGVTFCSLMPLRVVLFEVVCLLGMNDGDYPRYRDAQGFRSDGACRHGLAPEICSRRDDDRQLMLEALLSARRQSRRAGPGAACATTVNNPPRYWCPNCADTWRQGGGRKAVSVAAQPARASLAASACSISNGDQRLSPTRVNGVPRTMRPLQANHRPRCRQLHPLRNLRDPANPLTIVQLARFLRNPVSAYFKMRLSVGWTTTSRKTPTKSPGASPDWTATDSCRNWLIRFRPMRRRSVERVCCWQPCARCAWQDVCRSAGWANSRYRNLTRPCRRCCRPGRHCVGVTITPRQGNQRASRRRRCGCLRIADNWRYCDPVAGQAPTDPQPVPQPDACCPTGRRSGRSSRLLQMEPVRLCNLTHGEGQGPAS